MKVLRQGRHGSLPDRAAWLFRGEGSMSDWTYSAVGIRGPNPNWPPRRTGEAALEPSMGAKAPLRAHLFIRMRFHLGDSPLPPPPYLQVWRQIKSETDFPTVRRFLQRATS